MCVKCSQVWIKCVLKGWIGGRPVSCEVYEVAHVSFKCVSSLWKVCVKGIKFVSRLW